MIQLDPEFEEDIWLDGEIHAEDQIDIGECDEEMVDQSTVAGQEGISLDDDKNQHVVQEMGDSSVWKPGLDAGSYVSRQRGALFSLKSPFRFTLIHAMLAIYLWFFNLWLAHCLQ